MKRGPKPSPERELAEVCLDFALETAYNDLSFRMSHHTFAFDDLEQWFQKSYDLSVGRIDSGRPAVEYEATKKRAQRLFREQYVEDEIFPTAKPVWKRLKRDADQTGGKQAQVMWRQSPILARFDLLKSTLKEEGVRFSASPGAVLAGSFWVLVESSEPTMAFGIPLDYPLNLQVLERQPDGQQRNRVTFVDLSGKHATEKDVSLLEQLVSLLDSKNLRQRLGLESMVEAYENRLLITNERIPAEDPWGLGCHGPEVLDRIAKVLRESWYLLLTPTPLSRSLGTSAAYATMMAGFVLSKLYPGIRPKNVTPGAWIEIFRIPEAAKKRLREESAVSLAECVTFPDMDGTRHNVMLLMVAQIVESVIHSDMGFLSLDGNCQGLKGFSSSCGALASFVGKPIMVALADDGVPDFGRTKILSVDSYLATSLGLVSVDIPPVPTAKSISRFAREIIFRTREVSPLLAEHMLDVSNQRVRLIYEYFRTIKSEPASSGLTPLENLARHLRFPPFLCPPTGERAVGFGLAASLEGIGAELGEVGSVDQGVFLLVSQTDEDMADAVSRLQKTESPTVIVLGVESHDSLHPSCVFSCTPARQHFPEEALGEQV